MSATAPSSDAMESSSATLPASHLPAETTVVAVKNDEDATKGEDVPAAAAESTVEKYDDMMQVDTTPPVNPVPAPTVEYVDIEPPHKVHLNKLFTRPADLAPGEPFPSISKRDQVKVKAWMEKDGQYEVALQLSQSKQAIAFEKASADLNQRDDWLGATPTMKPPGYNLMLNQDRLLKRSGGKRGLHRQEIPLSKSQVKRIAASSELLVPIRIEFEHEVYKLRDTFTWNLRETSITPELFASYLCEDMRLPRTHFYKEIVQQVTQQLTDARSTAGYSAYLGDEMASEREECRQWFERRAKRCKVDVNPGQQDSSAVDDGLDRTDLLPGGFKRNDVMDFDEVDDEGDKPILPFQYPIVEGASQELRISIRIDITLNSVQLLDKFEWDISDSRNSPEEFAAAFSSDLGLNGEFRTAIAHSIREQIDAFVRSLFLLEHISGFPIADEDLKREFLPTLYDTIRVEAGDFTPSLNRLNEYEIDRNDKEREREVRRKRRQTKGRGITLPDREPVKTHRTLVPKPSSAALDSHTDMNGNMQFRAADLSIPYAMASDVLFDSPSPPLSTIPPPSPSKPCNNFGRPNRIGSATPQLGTPRIGSIRVKRLQTEEDVGSEGTSGGEGSMSDVAIGLKVAGSASPGRLSSKSKLKVEPTREVFLAELGLHHEMIDGVWHCANCGIPDIYAVGRRKGSSGASTLCGTCGKYYNRFHRNLPCTYSNDPGVHRLAGVAIKQPSDAIIAKQAAVRAASIAASLASSLSSAAPALVSPNPPISLQTSVLLEEPAPVLARGPEVGRRSRKPTPAGATRRRRGSSDPPEEEEEEEEEEEDSDGGSSFASEPVRGRRSPDPAYGSASPLSVASSLASVSPPPAPAVTIFAPRPPTIASAVARVTTTLGTQLSDPTAADRPLPWMAEAADALRARQVDDRFDIISRGTGWRIRCLDCPGKLYNLGPGETLDNFSVHFKNRKHRSNVDDRITKARQ